jgi:hypothetical protein
MNKIVDVMKKCWKGILLVVLLAILIGGSIYINNHSKVISETSEDVTTQTRVIDETEKETKKKGITVEETIENNDEWGPIR